MRVIKHGKFSGLFRLPMACQWECVNCEAVIESTRTEGRYVSYAGGSYVAVDCPECRRENLISVNMYARNSAAPADAATSATELARK